MDLGISGRVAVVGGASSGLGRAVARSLAEAGCSLVVWARDAERLGAVATELRGLGAPTVVTVAADAGRPDAAERVADAAMEAFGHADILVLNAGGPPPGAPASLDETVLRDALQLLLETPVSLTRRLLPGMRERGWGRVVALLSWGVREPVPTLPLSNVGRSGLAAYLKSLSLEVASDGVTVNGVLTGRFATPRIVQVDTDRASREGRALEEVQAAARAAIPVGRDGDPAEMGDLVAFMCSERAAYLNGALVPLDGGMLRSLG
jgi:3-oxoacyl-[acyl-carrier protein] reductase